MPQLCDGSMSDEGIADCTVTIRSNSLGRRIGRTAMDTATVPSREQLLHALYEAAELEHNLMCTYLYAAFSLRSGEDEGLTSAEAGAVARWRAAIIRVAVEEMGHLTAVWNIT